LPVEVGPKKINYTLERPWTQEFTVENRPGVHKKKIFVEPIKEWSFYRGDKVTDIFFVKHNLCSYFNHIIYKVKVLVGKDKGKIGIVDYICEVC